MTSPIHQLRVTHRDAARGLAARIRRTAKPPGHHAIVPAYRQGVVVSNEGVVGGNPPTCTVQFDTVTPGPAVPGVRWADPIVPVAGDVVYVAALGGDNWVITRLKNDGCPAYLETTTTITGVGATETMNTATFLTVRLEAGRRYRVEGHCRGDGTAAITVDCKIRYAAGANPTTSSTLAAVDEGLTNAGASGARTYLPTGYPLIAGSTGDRTFGMSIHDGAGGGTVSMITGGAGAIWVAVSEFR